MNQQLVDYIRSLSKNDKKSLSKKVLKGTEELGELAKAVLPFENAAGTLHRFTDREQILENSVDVILCALSVIYDLDFSEEEIETMLWKKSKKWGGIQAKEDNVKFPIPFEIHCTIEAPDKISKFKQDCELLNVKPIVIDLEKNQKVVLQDVMTSSVHLGDGRSAYDYAMSLRFDLSMKGYTVSRVKIETVPWHPGAPSDKDEIFIMPYDSYFESHIRIVTTEERKSELEEISKLYDAHLSRNFFKKLNENEYIIMMTIRSTSSTRESFQKLVEEVKHFLRAKGFMVDKTEIEFAVYDTKINHDEVWIKETN